MYIRETSWSRSSRESVYEGVYGCMCVWYVYFYMCDSYVGLYVYNGMCIWRHVCVCGTYVGCMWMCVCGILYEGTVYMWRDV